MTIPTLAGYHPYGNSSYSSSVLRGKVLPHLVKQLGCQEFLRRKNGLSVHEEGVVGVSCRAGTGLLPAEALEVLAGKHTKPTLQTAGRCCRAGTAQDWGLSNTAAAAEEHLVHRFMYLTVTVHQKNATNNSI